MPKPILIIEDDPDIAEVLGYSLTSEKFETRIATTGSEGLSASLDQQQPPSLILLDLLLPEMSGIEICRRLRKEPITQRIPIIMITAKVSENDFLNAKAAGVDEYFTKPFCISNIIECVRTLLTLAEHSPSDLYLRREQIRQRNF
jgi:DNA-binding response OmpR family regulator